MELLFFDLQFFPLCGLSCLHFLLGREHSTIVEGRRLGTVHIMEGTCSRLRFFFRDKYIYMCVYVCLCFFFVVWCRWWWGGVKWGGVWCGENGAKVAEQIV